MNNWYKRAELNKKSKIVCLDEENIPADEIEAVKLKDGCILFDDNLNLGHWGILRQLKRSFLTITDMESIGYINSGGVYSPIAKGEKGIWDFYEKMTGIY